MVAIIDEYIELKNKIPELIEISGFRNDYIAKKIGIKPANFSVKKQRANWTDNDVKKIIEVISCSDDVQDYFLLKEMRLRKNESNITIDELYKEMKWKL